MRFLPAGPAALLIELDGLHQVRALEAEIIRRRASGWAPGLLDVVPAECTILLDGVRDQAGAARDIQSWAVAPAPAGAGTVTEIQCRYDGPDLAAVAAQWNVPVHEAVRIHTSLEHRVAFCGFTPGFAYISGIGQYREVARRGSPRPAVPAGSVAVGGLYTGVYPRASPGGWQIIGHTEAVMWDPDRDPPSLLRAADRVRFIGVPA